MARPNTDREFENFDKYRAPVKNRLSQQELVRLDKELETFRINNEVYFPIKGPISYIDTEAWMKKRGALSKDGAVIMSGHIPAIYDSKGKLIKPQDCDPILYEQLLEDHQQWERYKWGEDQKTIQWDEISKSLTNLKKMPEVL